jgi:hypothetical protein
VANTDNYGSQRQCQAQVKDVIEYGENSGCVIVVGNSEVRSNSGNEQRDASGRDYCSTWFHIPIWVISGSLIT